jgi:hypothetical protein
MGVDEVRMRLRRQLEETYGMEGASQLLDDRPPGGWQAVVTRDYLDLRLDALESRLHAEIVESRAEIDRRFRTQTWFLCSALITGLGVFGAIVQI